MRAVGWPWSVLRRAGGAERLPARLQRGQVAGVGGGVLAGRSRRAGPPGRPSPAHSRSTTSSGRNVVMTRPPARPSRRRPAWRGAARSSSGDSVVASTSMPNRSKSARGRNVRLGQALGERVVDLVGGLRAAAACATPKTSARVSSSHSRDGVPAQQVPVLGERPPDRPAVGLAPVRPSRRGTPSRSGVDALAVAASGSRSGRARRAAGPGRGTARRRRAAHGSTWPCGEMIGRSRACANRTRGDVAGPGLGGEQQVGVGHGAPQCVDGPRSEQAGSSRSATSTGGRSAIDCVGGQPGQQRERAVAGGRACGRAGRACPAPPANSAAVIRASAPPWPSRTSPAGVGVVGRRARTGARSARTRPTPRPRLDAVQRPVRPCT